MYGIGIWRGLGVTLKRFVSTYASDLAWLGTRRTPETFALRQGTQAEGIFTVEYPDEKIAVPERFRFVPFLVVNNYDHPYAPGHDWCTSCGICAKVCPPQCIWIVRGNDATTGRPKPEPEAFYIDIDICMNCGYCAEYCPFDAIKMDHDYELASYDRTSNHIYDKPKLSKESRYWQTISPQNAYDEAQARGQWEHKDTAKLAKKANIPMTNPENWDDRLNAFHNPDSATMGKGAVASVAKPAGARPAVPAGTAPAATTIKLDIDGATPDQLAEWAGNEGLPLPARSAASVRLSAMIADKSFKPASNHRKAVSAAQKAAKEAGTTTEDAAQSFKPGEVIAAPVAAPAMEDAAPSASTASPAVRAAAPEKKSLSINIEGANPDQLADWAGNETLPLEARAAAAVRLEQMVNDKSFKPASIHRKAISAAKKAATEAGTSIDAVGSGFTGGAVVTEAVEAATDVEEMVATIVTPVAEAAPVELNSAPGGDNDLIAQGRELERRGNAKEIKLTSADRKIISQAKKAAQEAGIEW